MKKPAKKAMGGAMMPKGKKNPFAGKESRAEERKEMGKMPMPFKKGGKARGC